MPVVTVVVAAAAVAVVVVAVAAGVSLAIILMRLLIVLLIFLILLLLIIIIILPIPATLIAPLLIMFLLCLIIIIIMIPLPASHPPAGNHRIALGCSPASSAATAAACVFSGVESCEPRRVQYDASVGRPMRPAGGGAQDRLQPHIVRAKALRLPDARACACTAPIPLGH